MTTENENKESSERTYIKMDNNLKTSEERIAKVQEIIDNTPPEKLSSDYLTRMADYILNINTIKERKEEKPIISKNHLDHINTRETSFEGLVSKLENGEDGIYNMIANDKNILLSPRKPITQEDIDEIPELKETMKAIEELEEARKKATGKKRSTLLKMIIQKRQDSYVIKNGYKPPSYSHYIIKTAAKMDLSERIYMDENGELHSNGLINFFDPKHISALLCNYVALKEETWDRNDSDMKWALVDLEDLVGRAIEDKYPLYFDLITYKIDGLQNTDIQILLEQKYGIKHSPEYLSSLWRNKIPKMIALQAEKEWLEWHFTQEEKGVWKKCSCCGQVKLAHNHFFSKNNTSKDHYYSICKECRNKKNK